ncbi:MAG: ABC transporter permease [Oscillospiraceae bacterium]
MNVIINILIGIVEEGLMYALLAMGMYITYSILDFPDLSVDGTFPLGAVLTGVLIMQGVDPWLCLLISFAAGMLAGMITGIMHVKLNIIPLLCGIIMYTAMLSVNLVIIKTGTGGMAIASFFTKNTIFNSGLAELIPAKIGGFALRTAIISLVIVVVCKILVDLYLKTKSGLLLRATGDNDRYTVMLGKDPGTVKILGLMLGNGFAALAGSVIAQNKGSADQQMGVGMVVLGLASVIIGLSIFKRVKFMKGTTIVILGSLVYKASYQIVLSLGVPTEWNNLVKALIFLIALILGGPHLTKLFKGLVKRHREPVKEGKNALSE